MKILLVPSVGNHTQTVLLLSLPKLLHGEYFLVLWQTDSTADSVIRELARQRGVIILQEEEALQTEFDRAYIHGWSRSEEFISELRASEIFIYGDGLNNRIWIENTPGAVGVVFWGIDSSLGTLHLNNSRKLSLEFVPFSAVSATWHQLLRIAKVPLPYSSPLTSHSLLVCFRYWGSDSYAGITALDVLDVLKGVREQARHAKKIFVVSDNRWALPMNQVQLVRNAFPESLVRKLKVPSSYSRKLGHLANFDSFIFSCEFPEMEFFGFDGSPPVTVALHQPSVKVIVPTWSSKTTSPVHRLILENFSYHREAVSENADMSQTVLTSLVESRCLAENLTGVRFRDGYSNEHFGALARNILNAQASPNSESELANLQSLIYYGQRWQRLRRTFTSLPARFVRSRFGERLFYSVARYSGVKRILGRISRFLNR